MSTRPPSWNKYEAAILLDGLISTIEGNATRAEAIKKISKDLRNMALCQGLEIDSVYRNENGISFQLQSMESAYYGHTVFKPATKLFTEVANIYHKSQVEYQELLKEAFALINKNDSVEDRFMQYLAGMVSPAQLSALYPCYAEIESFCLKIKVLHAPLFQTTDFEIIKKVQRTIEQNKIFRVTRKKQHSKIVSAGRYYYTYIKEGRFPQHPLTAAEIEPNSSKVNEIIQDNHGNTKNEVMMWSFESQEKPGDIHRILPVGIIYFEENYNCNGWSDAYVKAIQCLQEDYPAIIRGLVGYKFANISKVAWCGQGNVSLLQRPIEIRDHLFVESSLSPDEIIDILKIVVGRCNMDSENLTLKYVYASAKVEDTPDSTEKETITVTSTTDDQKRLFRLWLIEKNGMAETSARSYSSAVHTAGQYVVQNGIANTEIFALKDYKAVKNIAQQLFRNSKFAAINISQHNRFQSAISKYLDFCRSEQLGQEAETPYDSPMPVEELARQNFKQWMETQHMQKAAILSYISDIKKCSEFARENGYISSNFFEIEDWQTIDSVLLEMKKDPKFIAINEQRYKRPTSAMHKLIMYRRLNQHKSENKTDLSLESKKLPNAKSIDEQAKNRYLSVLKENFEDGFRYGKAIDKNRFRIYYSDKYGCDLEDNDEQLVTALMNIGAVRDDRIFVKADDEQSSILSRIVTKIISTFDAGASCIYLDCLFNYFQETLVEDLHIYSSEALETVILAQNQRDYFKRYGFLCCCGREPNPQSDVIQYMRNSLTPVSYSTIKEDLWFIPLDKIKQVLVNVPQIVNVAAETYFYAPNLPISEVELQCIAELISNTLLQRSYISDVELTEQIEKNVPSVIVNTSEYSMWGRRNALAYLLRDKFSFRGAIISTKCEELSMSEVFSDFCKRSSHLSLNELKAFANELQTVIYWDSVYSEMIRINQNEFVSKSQIQFDINKIDDLLDGLIVGKYSPLKSIDNLFLHFPAITVKWNGYVLESFLVNYSKKFCLLHASFSATDCCGAIVRRDSEFGDYRSLIVDVLAANTGWANKTDALQLLVDDGYQQRRSYKDIENVMLEAKLLREQVAKK